MDGMFWFGLGVAFTLIVMIASTNMIPMALSLLNLMPTYDKYSYPDCCMCGVGDGCCSCENRDYYSKAQEWGVQNNNHWAGHEDPASWELLCEDYQKATGQTFSCWVGGRK